MLQWWNQRGNQKIPWDKRPWEHNDMKSVASSKSSLKREVCSNKRISLKKKKIFKTQPHLPPRIIRKRGTNRAPDQQRMDLIKIREVINRKHKTIEKINKTRSWYFEKKSKIDKCLARPTKNHTDRTQNKQSKKWKRGNNKYYRNPLPFSHPCYGTRTCVTQWSYEPCHAEPPKMDRS